MSTTGQSVAVLLLLAFLQVLAVGVAAEGLDPSNSQPCSLRDELMDPTHEIRYGVDVLWQIPSNPKGVLILAHGGRMAALGFFDPGPKCEPCYGLPESRMVVLEALRRGYAVIVVKSTGRRYDVSWSLENSKDLVIVTNVVEEWAEEHSLDSLPFVVWGHSSSSFLASALTLTLTMPLRAMVLMCGDGLYEVEELATPVTHPPTIFAIMPNDFAIAKVHVTGKIIKAMGVLKERGVNVTESACWSKQLYPLFFTERILCMTDEMSERVFAAYEAAGWIDCNGYMTKDPMDGDWKAVLEEGNALPFCSGLGDLCLVEHVEQELRMASAVHVLTSEANGVVFPWLDSTIMTSVLEQSILQSPLADTI